MSSQRVGALSDRQYWILICLAAAILLLVVLNIVLTGRNQDLQAAISERQQFINQTISISRLNGQLVQGLANLSASTGDEEIQALLAGHGISFTAKPTVATEEENRDGQ